MLLRRPKIGAWLLSTVVPIGCYEGLAMEPKAQGDAGGSTGDTGATGDRGEDPETTGTPSDDPTACGDVAFSPFERLNQADYRRTVSSLFPGIDLPQPPLPDDESGAGPFTSNVLAQVGTSEIRRYAGAANELAAAVVADLQVVLPCYDSDASDDACVADYIGSLADRAYRRPLSPEQREALLAFYEQSRTQYGVEAAAESVIASVLQSPHFVYHIELGGGSTDESGELLELDGYEIASRLSYFLWGTMPDDEAFAAAASGALESREGVSEQARRMLDHPAARSQIADFHVQLLGVEALHGFIADPSEYPEFDDELRAEMAQELEHFVQWQVLDNGGTFGDLLSASKTFVGPRLAALYGIDPAALNASDPWAQPVDLDPDERAGILTQSAFLASHADRFRGSPVLRGASIRQRLLCGELPPPPADVPAAPEIDPDSTSVREVNNQHLLEGCQGCHTLINPLGFAFLGYDSLGGRLENDGLAPVDESGELIGTDMDGPFVGARELADKLAKSQVARDCFVENWLSYAVARRSGSGGGDGCSLEWLQGEFSASGGDIKSLMLQIVETQAFTHRRLDTEGS